MDTLLPDCLDMGISEKEFYEMTLGEIKRRFASYERIQKHKAKEKASMDYIQANLIGLSIARVLSENAEYPLIEEAYPSIFDAEELKMVREEQRQQSSIDNFKKFAKAFN